jgi:hypothetical protein
MASAELESAWDLPQAALRLTRHGGRFLDEHLQLDRARPVLVEAREEALAILDPALRGEA